MIAIMACSSGAPLLQSEEKGLIRGTGMIRYMELEGGFYGLIADTGQRYDVFDLAESFQQDSLRVRFGVRIRRGVMSIRMWGQPAEVVEMARLDDQTP